jgi:hypothetical protein
MDQLETDRNIGSSRNIVRLKIPQTFTFYHVPILPDLQNYILHLKKAFNSGTVL